MTKEDWIRKLTSRKFWLAVAGFVTGIVGFLKNPTTDSNAITSLIMALGSIIAYCVAEGLVDAATANSASTVTYLNGGLEWDEPEEHPPEE